MSATGREEIPALTGVRFFAALFVAAAHATISTEGIPAESQLRAYILGLAAVGMSLFFVLSGFVIHYNYRDQIVRGTSGLWRFFVARFARLYPLFAAALLLQLWLDGTFDRLAAGSPSTVSRLLEAGPYYLTLTQSWFYEVVWGSSLIYQFGLVGSVAWSISTEWFFYLCYPVIGLFVLRLLPGAVLKLIAIAVLSVLAFGTVTSIVQSARDLDLYALTNFGVIGTTVHGTQDSLFRWLIYFSPYFRISEFILGMLVSAIFLDVAKYPVTRSEQTVGFVMTIAALAATAVVHALMFARGTPFPLLTTFHMVYGFALPVGLLLFCLARYDNPITRLLRWRPLILGGEVSYSLYLLHLVVMDQFRRFGLTALPQDPLTGYAVAALIVGASIAVAFVTYNVIEVPSRRWLRSALSEGATAGAGPVPWFLVSSTRILVLFCLLAAPLAILALRPAEQSAPPAKGTIEVVEATYGGNCAVAPGNATQHVRQFCGGRLSCDYGVSVGDIPDPAGGCAKDFAVRWRCAPEGEVRSAYIEAEASFGGQTALLECEGIPGLSLTPPPGTIRDIVATYGGNCGAPAGNATRHVRQQCTGDNACEFEVDVETIGDPAGGCSKDFSVEWRCSEGDALRTGHIPAEAGLGGQSVLLACDPLEAAPQSAPSPVLTVGQ